MIPVLTDLTLRDYMMAADLLIAEAQRLDRTAGDVTRTSPQGGDLLARANALRRIGETLREAV